MPQFIRHTTLPLRTRNPGPHAMHGFGQIPCGQPGGDCSGVKITITPAALAKIQAQAACKTANGFWNATTSQCLATPPPTGLSAVPTWVWLVGGAGVAGAAWWFVGRKL